MYIRRKRRKKQRVRVTPSQVVTLRKKMNCTPKELANILGVSVRTVQTWEKGKHSPCSMARAFLLLLKNKTKEELQNITIRAGIDEFFKKYKEPLQVFYKPPFNQIDKEGDNENH